MIFRRLITSLCIAASIVCLCACSHDVDDGSIVAVRPAEVRMVTLDLSVNVLEAAFPQSRSRSYSTPPDYEGPATDYEKLRTLRVVIVRPDGTIEHNRMVTFNQATGVINHDNLEFEVISGEKKKIYLFGNEKLVRELNEDFDFGQNLAVGKKFPTGQIAGLLLTMDGSKPVIDNSHLATTRTYLPMSECFDVDVPAPQPGTTLKQSETLFITRSLIKFSFCVIVGPNSNPEYSSTPFPKGTLLNGITLSGLAGESYYMPTDDTEYVPSKYRPSDNYQEGRYITTFGTPEYVHRQSYTFPLMTTIDMNTTGETTIEQAVYFPETKDGTYKVGLLFEGNEELSAIAGLQSLQLKDIPRNTHVKVNISFVDRDFNAQVDLLPYTGVDLNPSFGF